MTMFGCTSVEFPDVYHKPILTPPLPPPPPYCSAVVHWVTNNDLLREYIRSGCSSVGERGFGGQEMHVELQCINVSKMPTHKSDM